MDDQREDHYDLQHMLQGITVPRSEGKQHGPQRQGLCPYLEWLILHPTARGEGSEGEVRVGHRSVERIQIKKKPLAFQLGLY